MSDVWKDSELRTAYDMMSDVGDKIDDLIAWAEDLGYNAIFHKLEEALGPLSSAMTATQQYDDGRLAPRV